MRSGLAASPCWEPGSAGPLDGCRPRSHGRCTRPRRLSSLPGPAEPRLAPPLRPAARWLMVRTSWSRPGVRSRRRLLTLRQDRAVSQTGEAGSAGAKRAEVASLIGHAKVRLSLPCWAREPNEPSPVARSLVAPGNTFRIAAGPPGPCTRSLRHQQPAGPATFTGYVHRCVHRSGPGAPTEPETERVQHEDARRGGGDRRRRGPAADQLPVPAVGEPAAAVGRLGGNRQRAGATGR